MESFPLEEEYDYVRDLGQGTYGKVSLWKRKKKVPESEQRPKYVASKTIVNSTDSVHAKMRSRELYILKKVQAGENKNIVKYFGSYEQNMKNIQNTVLVIEACHGDLRRLISAKRTLKKRDLRRIGRQILKGLEFLHEAKGKSGVNQSRTKILHR